MVLRLRAGPGRPGDRVRRRAFVYGAGAMSAAAWAARAQQTTPPRVAPIFFGVPLSDATGSNPASPFARAFVHGLRDLGYVDGHNVVLDIRTLDGKLERINDVVPDVIRLKPRVIVAFTSAMVRPVRQLTPTIPIVMLGHSDLVGTDLIESLPRPGETLQG